MASAAASHLVEIADPPVPSRTSPIRDQSMGETLKALLVSLCIGVASSAVSWLLLHNGYTLYGILAGAIGLFAVIAVFSGSTLKAPCPYCGAGIDAILNREEGRQERCATCSEYSTGNAGLLRPSIPLRHRNRRNSRARCSAMAFDPRVASYVVNLPSTLISQKLRSARFRR
jgi:hypothetical protein